MNRDQIIDLLTAIAAGDRRTVGRTDVDFWAEILPNDLPLTLALEAVKRHFRERPGVWLEPGHIVQDARAIHREMLERDDTLREAAQSAIDARIEAVEIQAPAAVLARDLPDNPARGPRWVRCDYCRACPGEACRNRGRPELTLAGYHPARHNACSLQPAARQ